MCRNSVAKVSKSTWDFFNLFEHLQSNPSEHLQKCDFIVSAVFWCHAEDNFRFILQIRYYDFDSRKITSILTFGLEIQFPAMMRCIKVGSIWENRSSATDFCCSFHKNSSFGNCLSHCCRLFIWTALNAMVIRLDEYQWHDWTSNDKIDSTVRQHTEAEYTMRTPSNWDLPESFRPFSILSISGKIFEQTIKLTINEHSDRNNRWKFSNSSSPHI